MTLTLEITTENPAGDVTEVIIPTVVEFRQDANEPSSLINVLEHSWDDFVNENLNSNPLVLNSYVVLTRTVDDVTQTLFRGYIIERNLVVAESGNRIINFACLDVLGKLNYTITSIDGNPLFNIETPPLKLSEDLYQCPATGSSLYTFYPDVSSNAWIPTNDLGINTTLFNNIGIGKYAITGVHTGAGGSFQIAGDLEDEFLKNIKFKIKGSTNNNGTWTVVSSAHDAGTTTINVVETVLAVADGDIYNTTIIAGNTSNGFNACGLIQIGNEWILYDGYDPIEASGESHDGYWIFKNIDRQNYNDAPADKIINTSAATHSKDDVIYQRLSKKIHPNVYVLITGTKGDDTTEDVNDEDYVVQPNEGRIDFTYDILDISVVGNIYKFLTADYAVFDELGEDAINMKDDVLLPVLKEDVLYGGPGFSDGDLNIELGSDFGDRIRLTRVNVKDSKTTLDFIKGLLDDVGLQTDENTDAVSLYYNANDDKFHIDYLIQKDEADADHIISDALTIEQEFSQEDLSSAVLVNYTVAYSYNLVNHTRMWHPDRGDTVGSNTVMITAFLHQTVERESGFGWKKDVLSSSNNIYTKYLTDATGDTGWGLRVASDPGDSSYLLICWFNEDGTNMIIDKIEAIFDGRRRTGKFGNQFEVTILGLDEEDFDVNDPSNFNTDDLVDLSGGCHTALVGPQDSDAFGAVELTAEEMSKPLAAIVFKFDGWATPITNSEWNAKIKDIRVFGKQLRTKLIQLTDEYDKDSSYLLASDSYSKLVTDQYGMHKVEMFDIGEASEGMAITIGRLRLLQNLVLFQTRTYTIVHQLPEIPIIGDTVVMPDGLVGVVLSVGLDYTGGNEKVILRVLDIKSGLV